jgi:TetR/AcrR family transcriptional regulator, transcriptional repressor of bet genes
MPKQVDADAQRLSIAAAAIRVIGDGGLESARLRDVARIAGVTTGAVTHYFDGKDEVLLAALDEMVRRILEQETALPPGQSSGEAIIELASAILPLDEVSRIEWRVWLAFWGGAMGDERLRTRHREYYVRIVGQLAENLTGVGGLSPERANHLADAIVAAVDGIGARATLEPEHWPAARQRQTLVTLLGPLLADLDHPDTL